MTAFVEVVGSDDRTLKEALHVRCRPGSATAVAGVAATAIEPHC